MTVPLLDLKAQWAAIRNEIMAAIEPTLQSAQYVMGPPVKRLEEELSAYCGAGHAIACASGSDALVLALMALGAGPGDEVIVPAFTFFATAGAVSRVGARPVFADNDAQTFNLLPSEIDRLATPHTKAVIPVDLFGQTADMDPVLEAARQRGLAVIEDAAQSIGAKYKGRRLGEIGADIVILSFFPSKNLGCLGDGGMCLANNDDLTERMRVLRVHGAKPKYHHRVIGMNSRLDSLQAAALSAKLRHLDDWHEGRRANAAYYDQALSGVPGVRTPVIPPDCWSVYNQYTIRFTGGHRDAVMQGLRERGIGCEVYYPIPLHLQECYAHLGGKVGDLPNAERCAAEVLSIPVYAELTEDQRAEVVAAMRELCAAAASQG
jgi:dTDP-4-amino-4,6-dideoxygalactose transaminase